MQRFLRRGGTITAGLLVAGVTSLSAIAGETVLCPGVPPDGKTIVPDYCLPAVPASPLPVAISRVYFAETSAVLDADAATTLDRQADVLARHPTLLVDVYGQADPVEARSDRAAVALGLARSRAVMDYLIAKGIAAERIVARSRGFRPFANRHPSAAAAGGMRFASTEVREAR